MARVLIPKEIWSRLRGHDGLFKAAVEFVKFCENYEQPARIYKLSGVRKDGSTFEPYLRLALWHHHLHRSGDPLLVTQHVGDKIYGIALTTHGAYFGDEMLWLKQREHLIDWDLCDDIRQQVLAYEAQQ